MKNPIFSSILCCVCIAGISLYAYIHKQNTLMSLRLRVPILNKELKAIKEENIRLRYDIDHFESPIHLMELARKPEFGHLKHPLLKDIWVIEEPKEKEGE